MPWPPERRASFIRAYLLSLITGSDRASRRPQSATTSPSDLGLSWSPTPRAARPSLARSAGLRMI